MGGHIVSSDPSLSIVYDYLCLCWFSKSSTYGNKYISVWTWMVFINYGVSWKSSCVEVARFWNSGNYLLLFSWFIITSDLEYIWSSSSIFISFYIMFLFCSSLFSSFLSSIICESYELLFSSSRAWNISSTCLGENLSTISFMLTSFDIMFSFVKGKSLLRLFS